jgi:hypothetical protein
MLEWKALFTDIPGSMDQELLLRLFSMETGVVVLVAICVRLGYRLIQDPKLFGRSFALVGYSGDAMMHLLIVDLIRQNSHRIPSTPPQFLFSGPLDYPAFFHKLLSYVPARWLERFEWTVSPFLEGIHAAFVQVAAYTVLSRWFHFDAALQASIFVSLGFTLTPLFLFIPGRAIYIGERPFGLIWSNFYFIFIFMFLMGRDVGLLVAGVGCFILASISSKFSVQAMWFISLVIAVLSGQWIVGVAPVVATLLSIILSRGYYLSILSGHIRASQFYQSFWVKINQATSYTWGRYLSAIKDLSRGQFWAAAKTLESLPLFRLLWLVPWGCLLALVLWRNSFELMKIDEGSLLLTFAVAPYIVSVAINLNGMKFLGEAERYVEYAIFPLLLALALSIKTPDFWLVGVVSIWVLALIGMCMWRGVRRYQSEYGGAASHREFIDYIRNMAASRFITIPTRLSFPICYRSQHKAAMFLTVPSGSGQDVLKKFYAGAKRFPLPDPKILSEYIEKYNIDFVAVEFSALNGARKHGLIYNLDGLPTVFKNKEFAVYRAKQPSHI